jgi:predicted transcriptional regulator
MERTIMETLSTMGKRKMYNTTLDADLIRQIKILAAQLEKRQNDLLEEAIKDLLKKYGFQNN